MGIQGFRRDALVFRRLFSNHFLEYGLENILVFDRQQHDSLNTSGDEGDNMAHSFRSSQNSEYT